jgi:ribosomal protein L37E
MYALRHRLPQTRNKPAGLVCVGAEDTEGTTRFVSYQLERFFSVNLAGTVAYDSYTPPCYICGFGTTCKVGRTAKWVASGRLEKLDAITPDLFRRFEDDPGVVAACERLSWRLKTELDFIRP